MALRTISLGDLREAVYARADIQNRRNRVTPAEANGHINTSIALLRDTIIQARGQDYFSVTSSPIAMVAGQTLYTLPNDCYTVISVRIDFGGDSTYMLEPFNSMEEAELLMISASTSGAYMKYRLNSTTEIELLPQPTAGSNLIVRYMPPAPFLIDDGDTFDGFNGWEEFVILDAARKIATKLKEWELVNALKADILVITGRIKSLASRRDVGRPETVQDVRGMRRFRRMMRYRWGL